jgi:hypothetical protein
MRLPGANQRLSGASTVPEPDDTGYESPDEVDLTCCLAPGVDPFLSRLPNQSSFKEYFYHALGVTMPEYRSMMSDVHAHTVSYMSRIASVQRVTGVPSTSAFNQSGISSVRPP